METTIEGAQKRIALLIDWPTAFHNGETDGMSKADALEYIAVFLESVGDEMAAMSTAYNSKHDRIKRLQNQYVEALSAIDEWESESKILKATIASLEKQLLAAHDNR